MRAGGVRRLVVTGATGFLGREVVRAAEAAGASVVPVSRSGGAPLDLAAADAEARLTELLTEGAPATVIHLAGLMSGNDAEHEAGTVAPTRAVLAAIRAAAPPAPAPADGLPDLVHASSLSVYGYAALPDGATLDETTPLETRPQARDAYARAKLAQEAMLLRAAQRRGLRARVLRPGAIVRDLQLLRPIYQPTAAYGHFGRDDLDLPWERTDRADQLKSAVS